MSSRGNCYLCGAELGKASIKTHILKKHNPDTSGQECVLLKIEGKYKKDYWLYADVPVNKTLDSLDSFLRDIWLECCGHMSVFVGASKRDIIGSFPVGTKIQHEYDMGDTTETLITVMGTTFRKPQRKNVRLIARNVPPKFVCECCGKPADYICVGCMYDSDNPFYCGDCADAHEDYDHEGLLLPITNSPRMGACAYCGEQDDYEFVPKIEG